MTTDQRKEADKTAEGAKAGASVHGANGSSSEKPARDGTRGRGVTGGQTFSTCRYSPEPGTPEGNALIEWYNRMDRAGISTGD